MIAMSPAPSRAESWPPTRIFGKEIAMNVDRAVLAFAGFVVLLSVALGWYVHPYWYLLAVFAGLNMIQAAFTGFCPAAMIARRLGFKTGCAFQ
jgi:hypothetical protein